MKKTNLVLCAAFWQGYDIVSYVLSNGYIPSCIVTCFQDQTEYEEKIVAIAKEYDVETFRHCKINSSDFLNILKQKKPEAGMLAWWPEIVKKEAISLMKFGWINLHPSLLPYGRGKHGYYWSIVEGTPFGVSIHVIDEGIDTGPILFQKEIKIQETDTGETLYTKGVHEVLQLFKDHCDEIMTLSCKPISQDDTKATYHHSSEIGKHSEIHLDSSYNAEELLHIIRARSFQSGPSSYYIKQGKKYVVRISVEETTP